MAHQIFQDSFIKRQMCHLNYYHSPISDSAQAKTWANSNKFAEAIFMTARDVTMICGYQHIAFEIVIIQYNIS